MKKTIDIKKILLSCVVLLIGIVSMYPFIFMVSSTFKVSGDVLSTPFQIIPQNPTLMNFETIFLNPIYNFARWYGNTIIMTLTTLVLKLIIVTMTAYSFAKIKFKGREVIFLILLSTMMIPADVMIMPRYVIFKRLGIIDSMWALVLPSVVDVYFVFLMRQAFINIPDSLIEAATIDGCTHPRIYLQICMPLVKPSVATMTIFSFVWLWNDYLSPYLYISDINKQMLSVGIKLFASAQATDYGAQMAAATLALLPVIIMFLFCQKYFIEGVATSGVKG